MSSKRQFSGRAFLGRQFAPSLFRGVGTAIVLTPKFPNYGTLVRIGIGGSIARIGLGGTLLREGGA